MHCTRNILLPYELEFTCIARGYTKIKSKKRKTFEEKKGNFINRLKNAKQKIICECIEVSRIYEGNNI